MAIAQCNKIIVAGAQHAINVLNVIFILYAMTKALNVKLREVPSSSTAHQTFVAYLAYTCYYVLNFGIIQNLTSISLQICSRIYLLWQGVTI